MRTEGQGTKTATEAVLTKPKHADTASPEPALVLSACKVTSSSGSGLHLRCCLPETLVRSLDNHNSILHKLQ